MVIKSLRIELGDKYVVTGSAHDLILNEKKLAKEGKSAGQEVLSRLGYFSKFEHLVRELMHKEILESEAQTLTELRDHIQQFSERLGKAVGL
ncbi:DUF5405 family protein [Enterobacter hormaechei]|uniref:DUF5405 family protein n=1 Tax=Enterobacter hormaechei TaxID=158836 RepID=UPI003CC52DAA